MNSPWSEGQTAQQRSDWEFVNSVLSFMYMQLKIYHPVRNRAAINKIAVLVATIFAGSLYDVHNIDKEIDALNRTIRKVHKSMMPKSKRSRSKSK